MHNSDLRNTIVVKGKWNYTHGFVNPILTDDKLFIFLTKLLIKNKTNDREYCF